MSEAYALLKLRGEPLVCDECQGHGYLGLCLHGGDPYCVCPERVCRACGGSGGVACIECGEFEAVDGLHDVFCLTCEEQYQTSERWRAMLDARDEVRRLTRSLEHSLQNVPSNIHEQCGWLTQAVQQAITQLQAAEKTLGVLQ